MVQSKNSRPRLLLLPEMGNGTVYIRAISAADLDDATPGDKVDPALLLARAMADERGDRLFSDQDAILIERKSSTLIDRIASEVIRDLDIASLKAELLDSPSTRFHVSLAHHRYKIPVSELLSRWSARELLQIQALLMIEKEESDEADLQRRAQEGLKSARPRR